MAPQVRRKAAERLAQLIDPDRVLRSAAEVATSDLASYYAEDGSIKPMSEWSGAMRRAVRNLETLARDITPGQTGPAGKVYRIELWDKVKALDMLFKHLNLYKEAPQVAVNVSFGWQGSSPVQNRQIQPVHNSSYPQGQIESYPQANSNDSTPRIIDVAHSIPSSTMHAQTAQDDSGSTISADTAEESSKP